MSVNNLTKKLVSEFSDRDYAHGYMQAHTVSRIAAQIHALRKQRGWSQAELAEKAGMVQERVSKIENADFESVTLKTLNKFADAFDVHLHIAFAPFSQGIVDVANLSTKGLEVESRETDLSHLTERRTAIIQIGPAWKVVPVNPQNVVRVVFAKEPAKGTKPNGGPKLNTDWQPMTVEA